MLITFLKRRWAILTAGLVVLAFGWHLYRHARFVEECAQGAWLSERADALKGLASKMLARAQGHDGRVPGTVQEFVDLGLAPSPDVDYVSGDVRIRAIRSVRLVPSTEYPGKLIVLVERYEPPIPPLRDEATYVRLDGTVLCTRDLQRDLRKDNDLRRASELPEIR